VYSGLLFFVLSSVGGVCYNEKADPCGERASGLPKGRTLMLAWLFGGKCAICGKKAVEPRKYYNDRGKPIRVCRMCVPYAERRAFRKR